MEAIWTAARGRALGSKMASSTTVHTEALGDMSLAFCWGDAAAVGI